MKKIFYAQTVKTVLPELLKYKNAFNLEEEAKGKGMGFPFKNEKMAIGSYLCGIAGMDMAIEFMEGGHNEDIFLKNVSFAGESAVPFILRAINIRLIELAKYEL